jgi:hypothetical protein
VPWQLTGPLYVRIIWFQRERTPGDIDNIAKRILDALKGIVFRDDEEIDRCLTQRSIAEVGRTFPVDPSRIPSLSVLAALQALLNTEEHVLYIEIGPVGDQMTGFGPVE